ncbi:hypothetical protein DICSQDRAFT_176610 [Dichomitus squalens LYAD-421 SS1]|uniref:uncharacterized protein n=1 Tax=Dichomitus squalens (strain LYAD-421) TaxID=732165 RepID=UPI00044108DF|nr:uncharacterized protein DICSQDRAFT_176610 [Dichomitus squalens LYAD-421 SS1]EJF66854.1 hypothetical protein DICSQDRAFT_176610 [Dichomitus squalens LYAD-421 SS1]
MPSLKERLLSAEDTFLSALSQGGSALTTFNKDWVALMAEVDLAVDAEALDPETSLLVQTTTYRIAMLAETSIELVELHEAYTSQFMDQLDSLMSELSLVDHATMSGRSRSSSPSACESDTLATCRSTCGGVPYTNRPPSLKRRRDPDDTISETLKRPRYICIVENDDTPSKDISSLPVPCRNLSTPVSPDSPVYPPAPSGRYPHPISVPIPSSVNKRKRRLSESDGSLSPQSSKRHVVGPRLHAVSESFVARATAPLSTTLSPEAPLTTNSIESHDSLASSGCQTYEEQSWGQVDILSHVPLPTDFFLGSYSGNIWSTTAFSESGDDVIDSLVQSLSENVDQFAGRLDPSAIQFSALFTTPAYDLA